MIMAQTQIEAVLDGMREGYEIMAEANGGGISPTELGWKWNIDGTAYYMLDQAPVRQLAETAIGEDIVGIVEAVKQNGDGVLTEVYAMDVEGTLHVVGLETLAKEAAQDIRALAVSLDEAEPQVATEGQREQFWSAVTWPLA